MEIFAIKTPVFSEGDSVFDFFCNSSTTLREKDILCVTSKIVSFEQGRVRKIHSQEELSCMVLDEADQVLRKGRWALTVKNGIVTCNAGIDASNV